MKPPNSSADSVKPGRREAAAPASVSRFAYVGCYTSKERGGQGTGICVFRIDPTSGEWSRIQLYEIFNPSFLAFDRTRRFLYSAHGDENFITAFAIDGQTGLLAKLNQQSTGGKNTVHLSVDPSNRVLVTANYSSGTIASFPIRDDGSLGQMCDEVALPGEPGPDKEQQAFSHPHHIPFDNCGRFVVVPDKGLDRIFLLRLDSATGKFLSNGSCSVQAQPGAGPRHVVFHPSMPLAYVNDELSSTVTTYHFDRDRGILRELQVLRTLPCEFAGKSKTAEILVAPSGAYVYVSNRGHDSISIFSVAKDTSCLSLIGWQSTLGKTPRFMTLDPAGHVLYAANQDSNTIVGFRILADGTLTPTGEVVNTGSPSCILFSQPGPYREQ
ncbi:MAG: lactonase family protein [Candidatus Korobacteraceae bacterium]